MFRQRLVNRAGQDHDNLRDYNCSWYVPTSQWSPGLEESLIALAAPWLPAQESKVEAALEKHTTYEERIEKCLVTSVGSLKAIRFMLSVSLCNAAAIPLGKDGELLDEEPIWKQFSHPAFNAAVFSSESFRVLEALVKEHQEKAEELRRDPPTPLTSQEFRATASAMQANIIGAINDARTSDPATAATVATTAVQNIIATATANAAGRPTHAPAGASTVATALVGTSTAPGTGAPADSTANTNLPNTDSGTGANPALPSTQPHAAPGTAAGTTANAAKTRRGTDRQIKSKTTRQMQSAAHYMKIYQKKGMFYCQNENLMTIKDIWTEYKYGWNHGPPLERLNKETPQWNKYSAARTLYSKRSAIYRMMEILIVQQQLTEDQAIDALQKELDGCPKSQHRKKPSLEAFNKMLRDRMKADAEEKARAEAEEDALADAFAEADAEADARAQGALAEHEMEDV